MIPMIAFIRTTCYTEDPGRIVEAIICALSLCAQKRNVSISTNRLSTTINETFYGESPTNRSTTSDSSLVPSVFTESDPDYRSLLTGKWPENLPLFIKSRWPAISRLFDGVLFPVQANVEYKTRVMSPEAIYAFNQSSNIPETMQNVATAITNHFRERSNLTVTGRAGYDEAYVRIVWPWIIFPASLIAMGAIFLIITMFKTKKNCARVWKTSDIPLLFYQVKGLDTVPVMLERWVTWKRKPPD